MRPKVDKLRVYFRVWLTLTKQQFQQQIVNARAAAILFIIGKLFRFATAFLLLYLVVGRAKLISGYTLPQAIFILALFNLMSQIFQMLMRGIYMFRQKVVDGTFDFYLLNPLSELFYSLFSYTDPMDLLLFLPYLGITFWAALQTGAHLTLSSVALVFVLLILAFITILAWHIFMISIGIRYLEVDNIIMLYRDLEKMAAFPVNMYGPVGSAILTYIVPLALFATIPANLIFGLFNPWGIIFFAVLAAVQLKLALWFWHRSLLTYSSASS